MKTFNKISFGVQAMQAGQKTSNLVAEPTITANSTSGKFTITSPVSKALNIAVGENVMFLNNVSGVESAVQARVQDVVDYANENGIDLDTREGELQVIEAFTQWFIAKGVLQYKANGTAILATERFTKEDKAKYLAAHSAELVEANRKALVEKFGDLTNEELAEKLTVDMIESPKFHAASGSKTSTTGTATGVGCQLGFTDTAIWNILKQDLGDYKNKINRVYKVLLDDMCTVPYNNGKEEVNINIVPIEFDKDVAPSRIGTKSAE
uniref:Coat protein n=1 Tax=Geladintestivirus 2 TaxID=3233134 RepID=A0AAU8MIP4_9CAUD